MPQVPCEGQSVLELLGVEVEVEVADEDVNLQLVPHWQPPLVVEHWHPDMLMVLILVEWVGLKCFEVLVW